MAAPKGTRPPAAGMGRKPGVPNKATAHARHAIALLIDGNAERLQGWLDEIAAQDGPRAAWQCFMALLEFGVPKLSRAELTGEDGAPLTITKVERVIIRANADDRAREQPGPVDAEIAALREGKDGHGRLRSRNSITATQFRP